MVSIEASSIRRHGGCCTRGEVLAVGFRTVLNFAVDQEEPENGQDDVHAHKAEQSEPDIASGDAR